MGLVRFRLESRRASGHRLMSALCHKPTSAPLHSITSSARASSVGKRYGVLAVIEGAPRVIAQQGVRTMTAQPMTARRVVGVCAPGEETALTEAGTAQPRALWQYYWPS